MARKVLRVSSDSLIEGDHSEAPANLSCPRNLVCTVVASMDMGDPVQVSTLELLEIVPIRPTDSPQATRLLENVAQAVMLDVTVHGSQIYFLCHAL
jgi:hypothetical protein